MELETEDVEHDLVIVGEDGLEFEEEVVEVVFEEVFELEVLGAVAVGVLAAVLVVAAD